MCSTPKSEAKLKKKTKRLNVQPPENEKLTQKLEKGVSLDSSMFAKNASIINNTLRKNHEHVSPKYTSEQLQKYGMADEYGGITGTLVPASILRMAKVLTGDSSPCTSQHYCLPPEMQLVKGDSIFCDIGSGTGRPSLYMANLGIRGSIGFDIDPMQVLGSLNGLVQLQKKKPQSLELSCNVSFFQGDVCKIGCLNPVTHAFGFLGYPKIVADTAVLVARSSTVKVFVAVVLHERELKGTGMLDNKSDILTISGMSMPGGNSYTAYVIPLTDERRKNVLKKCKKRDIQTPFSNTESDEFCINHESDVCVTNNFSEKIERALKYQFTGKEQLKRFNESRFQTKRRPRMAAINARKRLKI